MTDEIAERGGRIYVQALVSLIDTESTGSIEAIAYAREEDTKKGMDSSQITGAASSYARKYALCGLLAIDDNRDSDATNTGTPTGASAGKKEQHVPEKPDLSALTKADVAEIERRRARQTPPPDVTPEPMENEDGYYVCHDCKKIISGKTLRNGKTLSPKEVAALGMQQYGVQLCYSCGAARMMSGDAQ